MVTLSSNHWSAWQPLAISLWEYLSVLLMQYISSRWNSWNVSLSLIDFSPILKLTSLQFIFAKLSLSFSFQHQIPATEGKILQSSQEPSQTRAEFYKSINIVGDAPSILLCVRQGWGVNHYSKLSESKGTGALFYLHYLSIPFGKFHYYPSSL